MIQQRLMFSDEGKIKRKFKKNLRKTSEVIQLKSSFRREGEMT